MNTATAKRGSQTKPTRDEVAAAWRNLRSAARNGDLHAAALLLALVEGKPLIPVQRSV